MFLLPLRLHVLMFLTLIQIWRQVERWCAKTDHQKCLLVEWRFVLICYKLYYFHHINKLIVSHTYQADLLVILLIIFIILIIMIILILYAPVSWCRDFSRYKLSTTSSRGMVHSAHSVLRIQHWKAMLELLNITLCINIFKNYFVKSSSILIVFQALLIPYVGDILARLSNIYTFKRR